MGLHEDASLTDVRPGTAACPSTRYTQSESRRSLTAAERAVVQLAALGMSYKEIARELHKSPNTVDNQLRKIRKRLGVHNQIELVRACANLL